MAGHDSGEERQALFARMIENSNELALAADADGRIVYANPAALRALGYTAGTIAELPYTRIFDIPDDELPHIAAHIAAGGSRRLATRAHGSDGGSFPVTLQITGTAREDRPPGHRAHRDQHGAPATPGRGVAHPTRSGPRARRDQRHARGLRASARRGAAVGGDRRGRHLRCRHPQRRPESDRAPRPLAGLYPGGEPLRARLAAGAAGADRRMLHGHDRGSRLRACARANPGRPARARRHPRALRRPRCRVSQSGLPHLRHDPTAHPAHARDDRRRDRPLRRPHLGRDRAARQ